MNDRRTPHQAIVGQTGNTFGAGDELARDILYALQAEGYALVDEDGLERVNEFLDNVMMPPLVNVLRQDTAVCHHSRYGMECLLPTGHGGVHRNCSNPFVEV